MQQKPTLGRIVLFTLDKQTCEQINQTGATRSYIPGQQICGIVTDVNQNGNLDLTLFPSGPEMLHIANVEYGTTNRNRSWTWPPRVEAGTGGEQGATAA